MSVQAKTNQPPASSWAALSFIAGALLLRVAVSGSDVAASFFGALVFSAVLLVTVKTTHAVSLHVGMRSLGAGVAGGLVLIAFPIVHSAMPLRFAQPTSTLLVWSAIVTVVACSEEIAIRGMLFNAIRPAWGTVAAVAVTSVVFAVMHVPLYGWRVLPLDLTVGVWLGVLRCYAGIPASAAAHTLADLATGWLL